LLEHAVLTNLRQQQAAQAALGAVHSAMAAIADGLGDELIAVDLSCALDALGDIVGETTADDLLNRIFSEFCIGK
jgi:tRNA modification GTPase